MSQLPTSITSPFQYVTPIFPKKENCCFNYPIFTPSTYFPGNIITSSSKWLAWMTDNDGFKVTPLVTLSSKLSKQLAFGMTHAHQGEITNIEFSPFNDDYFITSSHDRYIKLWEINSKEEKVKRSTFIGMENEILLSRFHPTVDNLISAVCKNGQLYIVDSKKSYTQKIDTNINDEHFSSMDWKNDGSLLAVSTRKGLVITLDPRQKSPTEFNANIDVCKLFWTERNSSILLFGKKENNNRIEVRDTRNLKNVVNFMVLESCKGDMSPHFDNDTGVILCPFKNQNECILAQLYGSNELSMIREITLVEPTIGSTTAPKSCLNIMSSEIMRFIQLNSKGISPYSFCVPSRDNSIFHQDLFPDTYCGEPALTLEEWKNGSNRLVKKISLDPKKGMNKKSTFEICESISNDPNTIEKTKKDMESNDFQHINYDNHNTYKLDMEKYSKFRYIDSQPYPKTLNFTAYNQIFMTTSGESTGVACIKDTLVLPLRGKGGKLGVVKLSNPHRIPPTGPNNVENRGVVNDFVLDPFDEQTLVAVCENGAINVWKIPENGLTDNQTTPFSVLSGHKNRATFLKYHHMAKNIVASADVVGIIKIWDLDQEKEKIKCINDSESQITSMAWDTKGASIASTAMDKYLYIFDPRNGSSCVNKGICSEAPIGTKVEWVDDYMLLVSTLRGDGRQVLKKIDTRNLNRSVAELLGCSSPSPYILYYDRDINVAFGFNKGGNSIQPIELRNDGNGFFLCDSFKSFEPHQTVAFLRKDALNVRNIEIARSIRILDNTTELVQHKLLRSNEEYFQDDIFPPTWETWKPSMTSSEWLSGKNTLLNTVSLAPTNMVPLSQAKDLLLPTGKKYDSRVELAKAAQTEDEDSNIISQFMDKVIEHESKILPQDAMEGLSDSEWND